MLDPAGKLCLRAQSGDTEAASELIRMYYEKIFSYFRRQCATDEDAQDLTQKCFCKIWASLGSFQARASFSTWIHSIAYHVWIDSCRRKNFSDRQTDEWWETCAVEAPSPFENAAEKEMSSQLYSWVQELEEDVQAVVHLHYFQELSLNETAQALDIATSTVKYRLRNALKFLKTKIAHQNQTRTSKISGDSYERSSN
ncbi:MAG: RNA polymerase sigma factor [Verrucomicrobiota bacterium]